MKITSTKAKNILYSLLKIRLADEAIAQVYPQDEIKCPVHLSIGSEGVSVGVCSALKKTDYVIGGHRSHGLYLAKGASLNAFMAELYGRKTGCSGGKGGSMHLISPKDRVIGTTPILGSTIPIGVGNALATKFNKKDDVTVIFFGDGASEEGGFYESLNLAALYKLPVLFVCENNGYSIFTARDKRQPLDNVYEKGRVFGIPGKRVDGNNVYEVYESTLSALDYAREVGPYLLECTTKRWRQHVGPYYDYEIGFGSKEDIERVMKTEDPIKIFEDMCLEDKKLKKSDIGSIEKKVKKEVDESFDYAHQSPLPKSSDLFKHIY